MKEQKGLVIAVSILGGFLGIFAILSILTAFEVQFLVSFEWAIVKGGWSDFNLLLACLICDAVFAAAIITTLVVSDTKDKKKTVHQRRQNKYFE